MLRGGQERLLQGEQLEVGRLDRQAGLGRLQRIPGLAAIELKPREQQEIRGGGAGAFHQAVPHLARLFIPLQLEKVIPPLLPGRGGLRRKFRGALVSAQRVLRQAMLAEQFRDTQEALRIFFGRGRRALPGGDGRLLDGLVASLAEELPLGFRPLFQVVWSGVLVRRELLPDGDRFPPLAGVTQGLGQRDWHVFPGGRPFGGFAQPGDGLFLPVQGKKRRIQLEDGLHVLAMRGEVGLPRRGQAGEILDPPKAVVDAQPDFAGDPAVRGSERQRGLVPRPGLARVVLLFGELRQLEEGQRPLLGARRVEIPRCFVKRLRLRVAAGIGHGVARFLERGPIAGKFVDHLPPGLERAGGIGSPLLAEREPAIVLAPGRGRLAVGQRFLEGGHGFPGAAAGQCRGHAGNIRLGRGQAGEGENAGEEGEPGVHGGKIQAAAPEITNKPSDLQTHTASGENRQNHGNQGLTAVSPSAWPGISGERTRSECRFRRPAEMDFFTRVSRWTH